MCSRIRVIIVDDYPLVVAGFKSLLSDCEQIEIVGEAYNGLEAIKLVEEVACDVILTDIRMPVLSGIDVARRLKNSHPEVKIIFLTVEDNVGTLTQAIKLHVNGYLLKDSSREDLIQAIEYVYEGGIFMDQALNKNIFNIIQNEEKQYPTEQQVPKAFEDLSYKELLVLYYISEGLINKEIGKKLFLAEKTIGNIITGIFKKIGVVDRVQATILAINNNIADIIELHGEETL